MREAFVSAIPHLRAFALSLTHDAVLADDLVQETLVRAWASLDRFEPDSNLGAWLFTILHNGFYSHRRKRRLEVEDVDGQYASQLVSPPTQMGHLDFQDLRTALAKLPSEQQEVLLLATAQSLPYEEIAGVCGCAVGTVKSRIHRARMNLAKLLAVRDEEDVGPGEIMKAALQAAA